MKFRLTVPKTVPKTVEKIYIIRMEEPQYSKVKLFIPRDKNGRITVERPWHIYFYFRNPITGKFDSRSKFIRKHGINKYYKTVKQRKLYGQKLVQAYTELLNDGYDPYENTIPQEESINFTNEIVSIEFALKKALENKKAVWAKSTIQSCVYRVDEFIAFAKRHHFSDLPSDQLMRKHVVEFLRTIKDSGQSMTSVNNYRNTLGSILSEMVQLEYLPYNFIRDIKKERSNPVRNHPFTNRQVADIKKYLEANDPYLLTYIRVISYSFLRNSEVLRLTVGDVDLKNRLITVKTKDRSLEKVFIIDQLMDIFKKMQLEQHPKSHFVFSRNDGPGEWEAELKTKKKVFSDRFRPVKKKFNFGREFTLYSFRHTFAINLYNQFISQGLSETEALIKMLPITRHRSIDMASNYVREKQRMLPRDYSKDISIDL